MTILLSTYQLSMSNGVKCLFNQITFGIVVRKTIGLVGPNRAWKDNTLSCSDQFSNSEVSL